MCEFHLRFLLLNPKRHSIVEVGPQEISPLEDLGIAETIDQVIRRRIPNGY